MTDRVKIETLEVYAKRIAGGGRPFPAMVIGGSSLGKARADLERRRMAMK